MEFLNLASIFPSKTEFSQHYFLCVQKGVETSFLRCFWHFWNLKTCQNLLAICENSYLFMINLEVLSFPQKEVPSKSTRQVVARCIRQKNLFFRPKISKLQKVSQISWNLGWVSFIKCCVGPRKPQRRSEVYLALFASSMPSSTWPSKSWFLLCTPCFSPSNDGPCAST